MKLNAIFITVASSVMAALPSAADEKTGPQSNNGELKIKWIELINNLYESKAEEPEYVGKTVEWTALVLSKTTDSNVCEVALDLNHESNDFFHGAYQGADMSVIIPLNDSEGILEEQRVNVRGTISEIKGFPRSIFVVLPNGKQGEASTWAYWVSLTNAQIFNTSK